MPFLSPNQQRQSTEGNIHSTEIKNWIKGALCPETRTGHTSTGLVVFTELTTNIQTHRHRPQNISNNRPHSLATWPNNYAAANDVSAKKGKGSPYSITERRVPELIPVLGSQPSGDVHNSRLPLVSARPAVTLATPKRAATSLFCCLVYRGTLGVNSLPKTVTRQRRGCNLNPGPTAPESSTLTTRLPSHPS